MPDRFSTAGLAHSAADHLTEQTGIAHQMAPAKTKSFRDPKGNRFIFPSMIIRRDDPDARSAYDVTAQAMMLNIFLDIQMEDDWFEFDIEAFPHVSTEVLSRKFQHGAATVYLFEGPEFNEAVNAASETEA